MDILFWTAAIHPKDLMKFRSLINKDSSPSPAGVKKKKYKKLIKKYAAESVLKASSI